MKLSSNRLLIAFIFFKMSFFGQDFLRVSYTRFGSTKNYEITTNEILEFKLKGESKFHKYRITAMRDSMIMLENENEVKLNQLKAIRLKTHNHLVGTLKTVFIFGGVGFIGLNTINNLITNTSPVFNEKAAYISAALIATGLVIREIGIKRIRVTKNTDLKILNIDYQHMNVKDTIR